MTAHSHRLAYVAVEALDGVGGVENFSHRRSKCEERNHLFPVAPPALRDGGEFSTPRADYESACGALTSHKPVLKEASARSERRRKFHAISTGNFAYHAQTTTRTTTRPGRHPGPKELTQRNLWRGDGRGPAASAVFKTVSGLIRSWVGSTPIHLRQFPICRFS